jgi:hypothetical protein
MKRRNPRRKFFEERTRKIEQLLTYIYLLEYVIATDNDRGLTQHLLDMMELSSKRRFVVNLLRDIV